MTEPILPPAAPPAAPPAPAGPTFTQEQVNGFLARERQQLERKYQSDLAASLGVSDLAEAKTALDAARAAQEAQMTEAQKLSAAAAKQTSDAQAALAQARQLQQQVRVERALLAAGVSPVIVDAQGQPVANPALAMAARMVDVADGADDAAVAAAVAGVKTVVPALFAPAAPAAAVPAVPGLPGAPGLPTGAPGLPAMLRPPAGAGATPPAAVTSTTGPGGMVGSFGQAGIDEARRRGLIPPT